MTEIEIFEAHESAVRTYCRNWPVVFDRAVGSWIYDESGRPYLDFFAGAGALNYGHNDPVIKRRLLDYLGDDRVTHSLDMYTTAKGDFLATLAELVLAPRSLDYKVQFPGPSGATAVEAALKLARKVTGRTEVVSFSGGFHGMTLGALAVTANPFYRRAAGVPLLNATEARFDRCDGESSDELGQLAQMLSDWKDRWAAVIVETVQGEGGINVARVEWLQALEGLCRRSGVLLIVDDIQMGCGRTGPFFSFEAAGITPDIVCVSKSIGGYGLPLALTLIRPELDQWLPGEHTGTFRGGDLAFVAGTAALERYWATTELEHSTAVKGERVRTALVRSMESNLGAVVDVRGRGLANALVFERPEVARQVCRRAFGLGLLVETAGLDDQVVKLFPALTVSESDLDRGLEMLAEAVRTTLAAG
jgi:diaminobutyrate-2-oxoglutarate transaminase